MALCSPALDDRRPQRWSTAAARWPVHLTSPSQILRSRSSPGSSPASPRLAPLRSLAGRNGCLVTAFRTRVDKNGQTRPCLLRRKARRSARRLGAEVGGGSEEVRRRAENRRENIFFPLVLGSQRLCNYVRMSAYVCRPKTILDLTLYPAPAAAALPDPTSSTASLPCILHRRG